MVISEEICRQIIEQYYDMVYKHCLEKLGNPADAEDCVQETFLVFFRKRHILFLTSRIKNWLLKTADNVIKQYKEKAPKNCTDIEEVSDYIADKNDDIDPLTQIYEYLPREEADLLRDYVMCKSKQEREALAEKLGISLSALTTRISRIKRKLLDKIDN